MGTEVRQQGALHVERHRREMESSSAGPFRGDECRARRNLFMRRTSEAVNQAADIPLVEQPGAYAGSAKRMNPGQIDAAVPKFLEYVRWIILTDDAYQSRARPPHCCAESAVQQRATRLSHPRRAVGKDHIVDEEVAEEHDRRDHRS
jgi:hypothetical protein